MLSSILITLALTGQGPARNEIGDLVTARPTPSYRATRASRMARYRASNAAVAREVAVMQAQAAAIQAEQARQYRADLPYMLEMRRQDLDRQSRAESNAIINRYLNGNGGIYVPPITVVPQPANNGNMMPTP